MRHATAGSTALAALLLLAAGCSEAPTHAQPETLAEAQALAVQLDKPVLVEFFTDW